MKKKVSMIVPVYNTASYIGRCMESLLAQTYDNLEIILVDDGSTDGSGEICDGFADRYPPVKVFHTKNRGVSAARNRGMEECSGIYLTFVDADDCLDKDMVEHLVWMIERTESDVAGCSYWGFDGEEPFRQQRRQEGEGSFRRQEKTDWERAFPVETLQGEAFIEHGILKSNTRCWSKLFKKESIGGRRFAEGLTIGEDMLFLLRLALDGKQFSQSNYQGYGYFQNREGAMMRKFKNSYMDQIVCWQQALEMIGKEMPRLACRTEAVLLVSVMLVVGKLSMLSGKERKEKKEYTDRCSCLIKTYASHRGTFRELERGYQIKIAVYRYAPKGYMWLYHFKTQKG